MIHCAQRDQINASAYLELVNGQLDEDLCSSGTKETIDLLVGTGYDDLADFLDSVGPFPTPPDPDPAPELDMNMRVSMESRQLLGYV